MKFILILFGFSFLSPVLADPIHTAARDGDLVTVQRLLKEGKVDINEKGWGRNTPLHYASENGQPLIVEFLLESGAAIDPRQRYAMTPLHFASKHGSARVVPILIKYGANVNAVTASMETPLHFASEHGHLEIVTMLLENGANINARTEKVFFYGGSTPLSLARDSGNKAVIEYLKSKGATE